MLTLDEVVVCHRALSQRRGSDIRIGPVSLAVAPGEVVGLVGPSGSGKTTLAEVAVGLRQPDSGQRLWYDKPTTAWGWASPPSVRRRAQLVPQHPHLATDPRLTLGRSLALVRQRHRLDPENVATWLERCEVAEDLLERRPDEVSGGQLQRFVLARALCLGPELLVVDEATSAQDAITTAAIAATISETAAAGVGVLFIAHDQRLVERLCDRSAGLTG